MNKLKTIWWMVATLLMIPILAPLLFLSHVFEWLDCKTSALCASLFEWKHRVVPYPISKKRMDEMESEADADL